jgi:hypothetical protein
LSNLTARAETALLKYKSNFINKCGGDDKPDLSIQLRVLDAKYFKRYDFGQINCTISCAVRKAKAIARGLNRSVCIFVTTNRLELTDMLVQRLSAVLNHRGSSTAGASNAGASNAGAGVGAGTAARGDSSGSPQFVFLANQRDDNHNQTAFFHSGKLRQFSVTFTCPFSSLPPRYFLNPLLYFNS